MPSEKTLKRIVIILGVLLVVGFLTLVSIIIYRAMNLGGDDKAQAEGPVLALPGDQTPLGLTQNQNVIIMKVRNANGEIEELVFDGETGEYLGKLVRDN